MNALKAAGVVFVPFDSGDFTDAANIAWAGVPESDNYMEPEATARYCVSQLLCCTVLYCTVLPGRIVMTLMSQMAGWDKGSDASKEHFNSMLASLCKPCHKAE